MNQFQFQFVALKRLVFLPLFDFKVDVNQMILTICSYDKNFKQHQERHWKLTTMQKHFMPWKPSYPIGITPINELKQSINDKIYNHNVTKPVF